jgi:hypothetical protein
MRRILFGVLLVLLVGGVGAAPSKADVIIRVPFFSLAVGSPRCAAPMVHVRVPRRVDAGVRRALRRLPPQLAPVAAPDSDAVQPPPPQPLPTATKAVTLADFARTFKPAPGTHDVYLIHPRTKEPVKVSFTLPEGSPKKVKAHARRLVFDYGKRHWVKIHFVARGKVRVTSH